MTDWLGFAQNPWMLIAASAVLIPLIIHLISKSQGRQVLFPHLALIQHIKQQPSSRIHLVERLLLFLRMLILLIASLLLAGITWSPQGNSVQKHVLVTTEWLNHSSQQDKVKLAESLVVDASNNVAIMLDQSNRELDGAAILDWQFSDPKIKQPVIWQRLNMAAQSFSPDSILHVYTSNRLAEFYGSKTAINYPIEWHILPLAVDEMDKQPVAANRVNALLLYSVDFVSDMEYVKAALLSLDAESAIDIGVETQQLRMDYNLQRDPTLIFYLAAQPMPDWLKSYAELGGWVFNSMEIQDSPDLMWRQESLGQGTITSLAGRYHPIENQQVASPAFPLKLAHIIFAKHGDNWHRLQGRLSESQITQLPGTNVEVNKLKPVNPILKSWLMILLVILFCAERLVSERIWKPIRSSRGVQ